MFDACEVIDAILDNSNLPKYDVLHDECISNCNDSCAKIFNSVNAKCELVQVSWVGKKQLLRSRRYPKVQHTDVTCETNNQNHPLAHAAAVDSEGKNDITLTSLLANETQVAFIFKIISIAFLHSIDHLRAVSIF